MKKNTLIILIVFIFSTYIFGQEKSENNLSQQNSTYSESSSNRPARTIEPYIPQQQNKKSKKEKAEKGNVTGLSTSKPEYVLFPVLVYDEKNDYVRGLTKQNFTVYEDGVEQRLEFFSRDEIPLTIVLVLDTSPSSLNKIKEIRQLAERFIAQTNSRNQVAIVNLNGNVRILNNPTNDRAELQKAIKKVEFGEGTSIYEGIAQISLKMNLIEGKKIIVFLTDGVDTTSRIDYVSSLRFAEGSNTAIFPIYNNTFFKAKDVSKNVIRNFPLLNEGTTSTNFPKMNPAGSSRNEYKLGEQYLIELAALTGGKLIKAENEKDGLEEAFDRIAKEIQNLYFVGYRLQNFETSVKKLKVRIDRQNLTVLARETFFVGTKKTNN